MNKTDAPLPSQATDWVEDQAKRCRNSTANDYTRALVHLDQNRQTAIAHLQRLIDEGLASGPAEGFDMESFLARMRKHEKS